MLKAFAAEKLSRFLEPRYLIKPELVRGELPSAKEAYSSFFKIAMPAMLELVLIQLISSVDTIMVGGLGHAAISAVGLTSQPTMIMISLFMALNVGVTAVVARRKGEDRRKEASVALKTASVVAFALGILMTAAGLILAEPLLKFAGAKSDTIDASVLYFRIVNSILAFRVVTMTITAAQRGTGNTRISMRINLTANIVNVIGNFLLIKGHLGFPALGVAGAAIATSVGNMVGFAMALRSLFSKNDYLSLSYKSTRGERADALRAIFKVSTSAVFEQVVLRFGFFSFAKIVAELGTEVFAIHQICAQALSLSFTFANGLAIGATALVGINMGNGRPDISYIYGRVAQRMAMVVSAVLLIIFVAFGGYIVMLFSNETAILETGRYVMMIAGVIVPLQTSGVVMAGSLRGAGDTKFVAAVMLLTVGIIRPALGYLFTYPLGLGIYGAWMATAADITCRMALTFIHFSRGKWFDIKV